MTAPVPALVRAASRVRGERVIHARGRTFTARVVVDGGLRTGVPLLNEPATYDALLRLSRGAGLPEPFPDALGMAVRVLDAHGPGQHHDLLLDTGAAAPLLRRLPIPRRDLLGSTYSSLLSFDVGGRRLLFGALGRRSGRVDVVDLEPEQLVFDLAVATPHGPWQRFGRVEATGTAEDGRQVRFDPFRTGGGITPAGWLNALRRGAYPASHVGPDA